MSKKSKHPIKYYPSVKNAIPEAFKYGFRWWIITGADLALLFLVMFTLINHTSTWYNSFLMGFGVAVLCFTAAFLLKLQTTYGRQYIIEKRLKALLPPGSKIVRGKIYVSKKDRGTHGYQWDVEFEGTIYKFTSLGDWLHIGIGKKHFMGNIPFIKVNKNLKTKVGNLMVNIKTDCSHVN